MRTINMSVANWWLNKGCTTLCILQNKKWHAEFWHPPAVKRHEPRARSHVTSSSASGIQNKKSGGLPPARQGTLKEESRLEPAAIQKGKKNSTLTAAMRQSGVFFDSAWSSWAYEWTLYLNSASFYENGKYLRLKLNVSKAWVRERVDHWALKLVSFNPGYKSKSNSTKNTTWNSTSVCLWCGTEWLTFVQSLLISLCVPSTPQH